ncbi:hypothetical protein BKA66DRAFT_211103 [Pyrenochaeta sp. MPI-SDFR-AT-0127]|nr:hypothetical protein BKA66DRAFT_211103 [Pyrenochaeta sp. MPI-SDFR-AT-0127]
MVHGTAWPTISETCLRNAVLTPSSISSAIMQSNSCKCPLNNLQRMGDHLGRDSLPVDKILQFGSEFSAHLQTIIECETCVATKRVANTLSQITFRLICFYEAAYVDAVDNLSSDVSSTSSSSGSKSLPTSPLSSQGRGYSPTPPALQRHPGCKSVAREMKLGEMLIDGLEGRLLVRVVLMDACLDLNKKIQEWKARMEESLDLEDQQYLAQYNAVIGRCLDRLANLIGLLRLDALSSDRS